LYESIDQGQQSDEGDYIPKDFADWREIPSQALERRELRDALAKALESLPEKYREILILRTGWLLNNDFVWGEHAPIARKAGLTTDEIRRIAQGPDAKGWDPLEAALLRLADQLFRNSSVTDAMWKALSASCHRSHVFSSAGIGQIQLVFLALQRFRAWICHAGRSSLKSACEHVSPSWGIASLKIQQITCCQLRGLAVQFHQPARKGGGTFPDRRSARPGAGIG